MYERRGIQERQSARRAFQEAGMVSQAVMTDPPDPTNLGLSPLGSPLGSPDASEGPSWARSYVYPSFEDVRNMLGEAPEERRIDLILARLEEPQARALLALADWSRQAQRGGTRNDQ